MYPHSTTIHTLLTIFPFNTAGSVLEMSIFRRHWNGLVTLFEKVRKKMCSLKVKFWHKPITKCFWNLFNIRFTRWPLGNISFEHNTPCNTDDSRIAIVIYQNRKSAYSSLHRWFRSLLRWVYPHSPIARQAQLTCTYDRQRSTANWNQTALRSSVAIFIVSVNVEFRADPRSHLLHRNLIQIHDQLLIFDNNRLIFLLQQEK